MFPDDKHLETYLVPNKKPEPSSPVADVVKVAIYISIPVAISLTLFETLAEFNFTPPRGVGNTVPNYVPTRSSEEPLSEDSSSPDLSVPTGTTPIPDRPNEPGNISSESISTIYNDRRWIRIPPSCNGFHAEGANFRISPSLDASAIKGVVLVGERVFLTGETAYGHGIIWHRALNEALLKPSIEPGALNILVADQEGWIASCFAERL